MFVSLEGADYNIEPFSVEITASETVSLGTVCHSIVLIGDDLIEADETIQLQLITANSFINFIIDSAVVIIQDVVRTIELQNVSHENGLFILLHSPPFIIV